MRGLVSSPQGVTLPLVVLVSYVIFYLISNTLYLLRQLKGAIGRQVRPSTKYPGPKYIEILAQLLHCFTLFDSYCLNGHMQMRIRTEYYHYPSALQSRESAE